MNDSVQEIKERLDIVEFLRSYFPLKPAGKNFKAHCPFHKEKTPSFMVSPERQSWKCFGCGAGGDIFSFIMQYEHVEFAEALRMLAEKAGVELRKANPAAYKEYGVLFDINELAKNVFKSHLWQSADVLEYLKSRGLKKETVEEFELGLSPCLSGSQASSPDELTVSLINLGCDVNDLVRAGVTIRNEKGLYVDRFRNRLMFPIHNYSGKVVGFTGRILPAYEHTDVGKYVNSPETPLFNKSRLLYGWHKAKNEIRDRKEAILVEGQMDFLMVWQDGVKNVIATSGTALTAEHLKLLRRFSEKLVLHFDNDSAGQLAAERSIDLAAAADFEVRVISPLEDCKDPAEIVQKHPGLMRSLAEKALPAMEYYFRRYLDGFDQAQIAERKRKMRSVLAKIKNISSSVERSQWLRQLAERTKTEEKVLTEELDNLPEQPQTQPAGFETIPQTPVLATSRTRKELIAERLLSLAWGAGRLQLAEAAVDYFSPAMRLVYDSLVNPSRAGRAPEEVLNAIYLRSGFELEETPPHRVHEEIEELIVNLRQEHFRELQKEILERIRKLSANGDEEGLTAAMKELDKVSKKIHNL